MDSLQRRLATKLSWFTVIALLGLSASLAWAAAPGAATGGAPATAAAPAASAQAPIVPADASVLDEAEVTVGFAVLPTMVRSQEHAGIVRPPVQPDKRAGLHYSRLANAVRRNAE